MKAVEESNVATDDGCDQQSTQRHAIMKRALWGKHKTPAGSDLICLTIMQEAKQLTRKDNLKKNILRYRNIPGKIGDAFDILPLTFTLPGTCLHSCVCLARVCFAIQRGLLQDEMGLQNIIHDLFAARPGACGRATASFLMQSHTIIPHCFLLCSVSCNGKFSRPTKCNCFSVLLCIQITVQDACS